MKSGRPSHSCLAQIIKKGQSEQPTVLAGQGWSAACLCCPFPGKDQRPLVRWQGPTSVPTWSKSQQWFPMCRPQRTLDCGMHQRVLQLSSEDKSKLSCLHLHSPQPPGECPMSQALCRLQLHTNGCEGATILTPQVFTGLIQVIHVSPSLYIPCPLTQTQALPSVPTGPQHGAEQGASLRQPREAV